MKSIVLVIIIFCTSCASKYYPVYNDVTLKNNPATKGKVSINYSKATLYDEGSYANKAARKDLHFIYVKVSNNTDSIVYLNKDQFGVYVDYSSIDPMLARDVKRKIKQRPGYYFFWCHTALFGVNYGNGLTVSNFSGIGVGATGVTFGIYNYVVGRKANKQFYEEFMSQSVLNKEIPAREVVEGWICISYEGELKNLMIKLDVDN